MELSVGSVEFVPVVHRRIVFAEQVRRAAMRVQPAVIAVELPATLREQVIQGIARLPRISAVCWREDGREGELSYLPIDPCDAIIEAVRLGIDHGVRVEFIDLDLTGLQDRHVALPDELMIRKTGLPAYVETVAPYVAASTDVRDRARERYMAQRLRELAADGARVLCILGLGHLRRVMDLMEAEGPSAADEPHLVAVSSRPNARLVDVHESSLGEMLGEIPYLTWEYEQARETLDLTGESDFDKLGAILEILKLAEAGYNDTYHETINLTQWRAMLQYARNLALVRGRLSPDHYELVLTARGCVDGDYGYEVHELARSYPPQQDSADDLPPLRVRGIRAIIEGDDEKYHGMPRWEGPPREMVRLHFPRRPPRRMKEQWRREWHEGLTAGICSWPPEDEVQERFMDYVRKRALQVAVEDRRQVEEFSTSMLDGLDIRETMRNWHTGKTYVQRAPQARGRVGAVVVVFEDEPIDGPEGWRATLYAEHRNESDISFFASPLGENVVGPRISRTRFGGILSVWPAWHIPDIWTEVNLGVQIRQCSEALLAAGILFSFDHYVAYVAERPPGMLMRQIAAAYHKHIVYLPLHTFSRRQLRRIRHFHILGGHDVRQWARDYIFEE